MNIKKQAQRLSLGCNYAEKQAEDMSTKERIKQLRYKIWEAIELANDRRLDEAETGLKGVAVEVRGILEEFLTQTP